MSEKNTDNEIKNDVDIQDEDSIEVASEDADINTEDIEESEELTDSEENNDLEEDNVKKQITREKKSTSLRLLYSNVYEVLRKAYYVQPWCYSVVKAEVRYSQIWLYL